MDDDSLFPSVFRVMLAGIAILLIPVGVLLCFSVNWWYSFIPLAISAAIILGTIIWFFHSKAEEFENETEIL